MAGQAGRLDPAGDGHRPGDLQLGRIGAVDAGLAVQVDGAAAHARRPQGVAFEVAVVTVAARIVGDRPRALVERPPTHQIAERRRDSPRQDAGDRQTNQSLTHARSSFPRSLSTDKNPHRRIGFVTQMSSRKTGADRLYSPLPVSLFSRPSTNRWQCSLFLRRTSFGVILYETLWQTRAGNAREKPQGTATQWSVVSSCPRLAEVRSGGDIPSQE